MTLYFNLVLSTMRVDRDTSEVCELTSTYIIIDGKRPIFYYNPSKIDSVEKILLCLKLFEK